MSIVVGRLDKELGMNTRVYGPADKKTGFCKFLRFITWQEACEQYFKVMKNIVLHDQKEDTKRTAYDSCEWCGPGAGTNRETSQKLFEYSHLAVGIREGNESALIEVLGFSKKAGKYEVVFTAKLFTDNKTLGAIVIELYEQLSYGSG